MNHDALNTVDVVVLPETTDAFVQGFIKNDWPKFLKIFMDKGRKVIAAGPAWGKLPAHKNLIRIPAKASLRKAVEALY